MSRTAEIPDNLMVKWQSDDSRGKRATRRPITACQACRASKVKCDGRQRCSHCTSRGVACVYAYPRSTTIRSADVVQKSSHHTFRYRGTDDHYLAAWPTLPPTSVATEDMHSVMDPTSDDSFALIRNSNDQAICHDVDHPKTLFRQMSSGLTAAEAIAVYDAREPKLTIPPQLPDSMDLISPATIPEHNTEEVYSMYRSTDGESSGSSNSASPGPSSSRSRTADGRVFSSDCLCRDRLARSAEEINSVMTGNTISDVFQALCEFIQACQGIVECNLCSIQCTDLVCLISLFQRTENCFHYIASASLMQQSIQLRFAGTTVPVTDPRMRLMAVTNLVHHAMDVLDAIGSRGRVMLQDISPPTPLALTNIAYLENTIGDFKRTLDNIMASADQNTSADH